jgi:hypothetical protein
MITIETELGEVHRDGFDRDSDDNSHCDQDVDELMRIRNSWSPSPKDLEEAFAPEQNNRRSNSEKWKQIPEPRKHVRVSTVVHGLQKTSQIGIQVGLPIDG